jgi:hypothetical protein
MKAFLRAVLFDRLLLSSKGLLGEIVFDFITRKVRADSHYITNRAAY